MSLRYIHCYCLLFIDQLANFTEPILYYFERYRITIVLLFQKYVDRVQYNKLFTEMASLHQILVFGVISPRKASNELTRATQF